VLKLMAMVAWLGADGMNGHHRGGRYVVVMLSLSNVDACLAGLCSSTRHKAPVLPFGCWS
jgi:hypothetical protein